MKRTTLSIILLAAFLTTAVGSSAGAQGDGAGIVKAGTVKLVPQDNREREVALAKEKDRHTKKMDELTDKLQAASERKDKAEIEKIKKAMDEEKKLNAENLKKIDKQFPPRP